jgi:predicted chitinase
MTVREQLFTLLRNLRWIIVLSVLISILLYLPDQIRELYRIAADDAGWVTAKEFIAFSLIAITIWLGAFQLTTASIPQMPHATGRLAIYIRLAPIVLGSLPIVAAMAGQLASRPEDKTGAVEEVGSIFRIQDQALAFERLMLVVLATGILFLLVAFVIFAWRVGSKNRLIEFSKQTNNVYFIRYRFFALTIAAIALLTTAFILLPDTLAQFVGSFGVIALFTMCVIGITIHFALLTIQWNIPLLPLVFGSLFLIAALSGSDDHELRPVAKANTIPEDTRIPAATAFHNWLQQRSRVEEAARLGEYPVFIVAVQGGGIYAAHNAARFLARMQDLCPTFRQHLFAISSVSGGSIGSATFAAALHAENAPLNSNVPIGQTCKKVADFLAGIGRAEDIDVPGAVEQRVASVLTTDFLSPLVAGFLFSDFTQLFSPIAVPFFDRARFLEYTLENAADRMLKSHKGTGDQSNLLKADFQSHWAPDNNMPALLLNTTDVGSGKRVVISPFDIDPSHPKDKDLCILATLTRDKKGADETVKSTSLHIPLSTAAFASARFPWMTPASTVTVKNDCITAHPQARLVDGGYVENSGIETALDLIEKLKSVQGISDAPKFRIYLLSLVSGDFGDHGAFTFGELMEPVRALLSTRSSRTYIALNRAANDDRLPAKDAVTSVLSFPTFGRTDITGLFYSLPLGWTLSEKTGDIISLSSGRFWDCLPKDDFNQSREKQSNADCLQIKVFHLLNGSVASAFQTLKDSRLAEAAYAGELAKESQPAIKIRPQPLLACYESKWLQERSYEKYQEKVRAYEEQLAKAVKDNLTAPVPVPPYRKNYMAYFQAEQIKALLQEWDRVDEIDPRILAYILGSVSYDSSDFTRSSENFSFSAVSQIPGTWRRRIDKNNAALVSANKLPVDVNSLLNHPREFANFVLGYDDNQFGNRPGTNDGWEFRSRGMYQLVGREQYQDAQAQIQGLGQLAGLDLLTFPEALWNAKISAKVTFAHFRTYPYQDRRTYPYQDRALFELLKDSSINWSAVRALQIDMEHAPADQEQVKVRSEMFLACIEEASHPSKLKNWLSQFYGDE